MKRFTDTNKWTQWFRKLSPSHKSLWDYLYDFCGSGGIWERDDEVARLYVNDLNLDLDEFLKTANEGKERIKVLRGGRKWFVIDFLWVQCPTGLKRYDSNGKINRVHAPIYAELEKYGVDHKEYEMSGNRGSTEALQSLLDKDKDKDKNNNKNKNKDKKGGKERKGGKEKFGEDGLVLLTPEEHEKLTARLGEKRTGEYISRLNNYIASKGKRYSSHYHTILTWWSNDGSAEKLGLDSTAKRREKLARELEEIEREL